MAAKPKTEVTMQHQMRSVPLAHIDLSETATQVARRAHFRKGELEELVESIASHGVLQPIIVRTKLRGAKYELVAGERRYLASQEVGLEEIPAVVRELTDEQVIEVQLIENLQRKDLHPMQEAEGYQELMMKHGHAVEELHDRVGKSRSYVYGRMKLLALSKKAREAFYGDRLSASVALLIARIPGHKLQDQALRDLTDHDGTVTGFRHAKQFVQDKYMLRLKGAPFPVDDPDLHKQAGPCNSCPKRTGNQPELFGDIQSADVCTDPVCFNVKRREHGARQIKAAKAEGRPVVTGKEAKSATPYPNSNYLHGYSRLDSTVYELPGNKKVRSVIGKDAETALLQIPHTGEVVEVVPASVVKAALTKAKRNAPRQETTYAVQQRKAQQQAKIEKKFRRALFAAVRPGLSAPAMRDVVTFVLEEIDFERRKQLCQAMEIDPVQRSRYGQAYKDHDEALRRHVKDLGDEALPAMLAYLMLSDELCVNGYNIGKPERLLAAAAAAGVDVKALRKSVQPKKKAKKKAANKASKKTAGRKKARKKAKKKSRKKAAS